MNNLIAQKSASRTLLLKNNLTLSSEIRIAAAELVNKTAQFNLIDIDSLHQQKSESDSIEAQIRKLEQTHTSLSREKSSLEKKINMLHNHKYDPNCKFCSDNKFVKDAKNASSLLPKILEQLSNLDSMKAELKSDFERLNVTSVEDEMRMFENLKRERESLERTVETKNLKYSSNENKIKLLAKETEDLEAKAQEYENNREAIENLETLMREKVGLENSLLAKQAKLDKCKNKLQDMLVEEGTTKQILKSLREGKAEMEDVEKDWIAYDLFMQCMHPNGIPYAVIKKRLPLLNEEISKVLENIVDFEVFFINNGKNLDIMLKHPSYDPRPLSMGSGAEKTLASMAIRLALISITNLPKSELFILDEPATALDQDHMEGFTNLLRIIKNQFKTVILISHLDSLKDVVDMTIDISKLNGYANVRI